MALQRFICETCFGEVVQKNNVFVCLSCGNKYSQTKNNLTDEIIDELNSANLKRKLFYFDASIEIYDDLLNTNNKLPEAAFGALLSEYGIQYVQDYDGSYKPTCHRLNEVPVNKSRYYDLLSKDYIERANFIENVRLEVFKKSKNIEPYDVFICYKQTPLKGNEKETIEAKWAEDIYNFLTYKAKLRVFYAEKSLAKSNEDYEPHIFSALKSAKIMLVLTTDLDHLLAPWVQNEWRRYASFIRNGEEKVIRVITDKNKVEPNKLPRELKLKQVIDHELSSWVDDVINACDEACNKLITIERKEYGDIKHAKKKTLTQTIEKRVFENITKKEVTASETAKLSLAKRFLDMSDFSKVADICNEILVSNKSCHDAYLYLFLASNAVAKLEEIVFRYDIYGLEYFEGLLATANKEQYNRYTDVLYHKIKNYALINNYGINDFKLYVSLPNVEIEKIKEIFQVYYKMALDNNDKKILFEILKIIDDTDKYIELLLEFAKKNNDDLECLNKILEVDESNKEVLTLIFKKNFDINSIDYSQVDHLYEYGYNEFASDYLFEICLKKIDHKDDLNKTIVNLFDYVIKTIPTNKNKKLSKFLHAFIDILMHNDENQIANKYLDLALSIDKYDYDAHFKKTVIKYEANHNIFKLIIEIENIMKNDSSFGNALTSYAEKYPNKDNIFLNFYENSRYTLNYINKNIEKDSLKQALFNNEEITVNFFYESKKYYFMEIKRNDLLFNENVLDFDSLIEPNNNYKDIIKKIVDRFNKLYKENQNFVRDNWMYKENEKDKRKKANKKQAVAIIMLVLIILGLAGGGYAIYRTIDFFANAEFLYDVLEDGTASIRGGEASKNKTEIVIPSEIDGYKVTNIRYDAFENYTNIESLVIPDSVVSIGSGAFYDCINLKNVYFGDGLMTIDDYAFSGCSQLNNFTFPRSLTSIGSDAFGRCSSLTRISIPKSVSEIESGIFWKCFDLTVYCEVSSKPDGWDTWWNIERRYQYSDPDRVSTVWGVGNVIDIDNIIYATIDGKTGVYDCLDNNEKVVIPDTIAIRNEIYNVTSIHSNAFFKCTNLKAIQMPSNLNEIGDYAFRECSSLSKIFLPKKLKKVGNSIFVNCFGLKIYCEIDSQPESWASDWNSDRPVYWGVDDLVSENDSNGIEYLIMDNKAIITGFYGNNEIIDIPRKISKNGKDYEVNRIGKYAFNTSSKLKRITIPNSVTIIDEKAIVNCANLVIYCEANAKPNDWSENWCDTTCVYWAVKDNVVKKDNIEYLIVDNGLILTKYIADEKNIIIPKDMQVNGLDYKLTQIGFSSFKGTKNIECLTLPFVGQYFDDSGATNFGYIFGASTYRDNSKYVPDSLKKVILTNETNVSAYAFYQCSSLTYVELNEGVQFIGGDAFYQCSSLTYIELNEGIQFIGGDAFRGCNLSYVVIPSSVETIESWAFLDNQSIVIYCKVISKPTGWEKNWSYIDSGPLFAESAVVYWENEWSYVDGVPTPNTSQ